MSDPTPEDIVRNPVENTSLHEGECEECDALVEAERPKLQALADLMGLKDEDFPQALDVWRAHEHARHGVGMPGDGPS